MSEDVKYIPCSCLNINERYMIQCWYRKMKIWIAKVNLVLGIVE